MDRREAPQEGGRLWTGGKRRTSQHAAFASAAARAVHMVAGAAPCSGGRAAPRCVMGTPGVRASPKRGAGRWAEPHRAGAPGAGRRVRKCFTGLGWALDPTVLLSARRGAPAARARLDPRCQAGACRALAWARAGRAGLVAARVPALRACRAMSGSLRARGQRKSDWRMRSRVRALPAGVGRPRIWSPSILVASDAPRGIALGLRQHAARHGAQQQALPSHQT